MNSTTKGIIAVVVMGGLVFAAYKLFGGKGKGGKKHKLGSTCTFPQGGPDGKVVFMTDEQGSGEPHYRCRRCNETGCRSYAL